MTAPKRNFSRADVSSLVDHALEEDGAIIIKRPGRKDLAIVPAEKLREMDTTDYLLYHQKIVKDFSKHFATPKLAKPGAA